MRTDQAWVSVVNYYCEDCEFGGEAKNGVGLAAQHAEANPDHAVGAEQVTNMKWNEEAWNDDG